jgi:acetyl-CoA synthetase
VGDKNPKEAWEEYQMKYHDSVTRNKEFWGDIAHRYITWFSSFQQVRSGGFVHGDIAWFTSGKLNACYNCVDRHLPTSGEKTAIIWEGDEIGEHKKITYNELHRKICKIANILKSRGVKKGDVVTIYMPMIPETAMVLLACARIGAIHSVVFAGFSADSLRDRLLDCDSRFLVTTNIGRRGGKVLNLKSIADNAVNQCGNLIDTVFVFEYPGTTIDSPSPKDFLVDSALPSMRPYCPCEPMDSEDTLFILYTSGSTGKPKGVAHSTGGYLVHAAFSTETTFSIKPNDIYCCAADCGWITGHTYIIYGALALGTTTVMFESIPTYPNAYRYWEMVQTHKVTQFYTAPTAIRALMRHSADPIKNYDLSSLRILGTVGK